MTILFNIVTYTYTPNFTYAYYIFCCHQTYP